MIAFLPDQRDGIVILTNADAGYYFRDEVLGSWSAWAAGALPNDARFVALLNTILVGIAIALGLGLALWIGLMIIQIHMGKRALAWKTDPYPLWRRFVYLGWPLVLAGMWGFFWYSSVPTKVLWGLDNYLMFTFFPSAFHRITLVVCLWTVALSASTFIPKVQKTIKSG